MITTVERHHGPSPGTIQAASWFRLMLAMVLMSLSATVLPGKDAAAQPSREPPLARWLAQSGIDQADVGIDVRRAESGELIAAHQARTPFNPASLMKLFVVTAALQTLGPEFTWQTRFHTSAAIENGYLRGDLILIGDGDPKFVIEDLEAVIERMRARGLHTIDGNLVIDDGLFALPPPGPAFDGQPHEPYNVYPNAGLLNFNATKFVFSPDDRSLRVSLDPPLADVRLANKVRLVAGPCRYGPSSVRVRQSEAAEPPVITLSGRYSKRCGRRAIYFAVLEPAQFARAFFLAAWRKAGGQWQGRALYRSNTLPEEHVTPQAMQARQPWLVWQSPRSLQSIAKDINGFSNNVMSRMLALRLGAEVAGAGVDEGRARDVVLAQLALWGLDVSDIVMTNGSGLSRQARVSARTLGDLLVRARRHPRTRILIETLPRLGVDGTVRRRLRGTAVAGNAWLKTGSLKSVRAIAGYVRGASGSMYSMVMIVNGERARASLKVQDQLLQWLHANG